VAVPKLLDKPIRRTANGNKDIEAIGGSYFDWRFILGGNSVSK